MLERVKVMAPTRIDLAGGTLDIYPLSLLEAGGVTLNAAIDRYSEVTLEARKDGGVRIEAGDLGLVLEAGSLQELSSGEVDPAADLILRVMRHFGPDGGLTVRTRTGLPTGSGLGGSSSLVVSLSTALVVLQNLPLNKAGLLEIGANLETQSIRVPGGRQDFVPAAFGGFHSVGFDAGGMRCEPLTLSRRFKERLQGHLILGYSGASRFSGANNWEVVKRYVDGDSGTVSALRRIRDTSLSMLESLKREDLSGFAFHLGQEWENRKQLAEGVSTPRIERIFLAARRAGALASKICGAGGGGCFVTLAEEGCQEGVGQAIVEAGGSLLDYGFSEGGVRVS